LLRWCCSASEVTALVDAGLASVVVLDRRDRDGSSTLPVVRRLRQDFPSVPVVLYANVSAESSRDVLEFARAGIDQLILQGVDDLRVLLRNAVELALDRASAKSLLPELMPHLPPSVVSFVEYCLAHARRNLTVEEVAYALGVRRKTLAERMSAAKFPAPSTVIGWCRLLVAARLLEDPGRSVEQVALQLDFASATALRNMMKRYTGLRSGEVRENGGVRCVLHAFKRALTAAAAGRPR
jgi:AraC-like DNA-binding protein